MYYVSLGNYGVDEDEVNKERASTTSILPVSTESRMNTKYASTIKYYTSLPYCIFVDLGLP